MTSNPVHEAGEVVTRWSAVGVGQMAVDASGRWVSERDLEASQARIADMAASLVAAEGNYIDTTGELIEAKARIAELEAALEAQIAGHKETARQSTENLMRANTAQAAIDAAEARSRKHWQAFRDLRLEIIGHGPMCRDCADFDGRCQGDGRPCDPDEAVKEQIAEWKALQHNGGKGE